PAVRARRGGGAPEAGCGARHRRRPSRVQRSARSSLAGNPRRSGARPRLKRFASAALFALALAGCDHTPTSKSEWERKNEGLVGKEQADPVPPMPAAPKRAALLEFEVRGQGAFRYYVDGATLTVDAKDVVRYTLVARSLSGAENVTFEGINCKTEELR